MANDETLAALERAWEALRERYVLHGSRATLEDATLIRALIERERAGGERAQIVAWLRSKEAARIACSHYAYMNDLADAIEAGEHVTEK